MPENKQQQIHFISVGGAIMHQLAIALHQKGYQVSGSDDEIYDPSRSELEKYGLLPKEFGWFEENIHDQLDAVILGMHARKGNPELEKAQTLGIPIYSFPEYIYEQSKDKLRIVIAGSHGKTTTTAMVMHVLKASGLDFDYLVGARLEGFSYSVKITDAPIIVIEGDEYLSSALEMRSKFHFYHPQIALITGIAHDHINVFPTFESYLETFKVFVKNLSADSHVVWCGEDEYLSDIVSVNQQITTHEYHTPEFIIENYRFQIPDEDGQSVPLSIIGKHNMQNLAGAKKVCDLAGLSDEQFYNAIKSFKGASKRLQLLRSENNKAVFLDFAHAPSKVKATVESVAQTFKDKRLIAIFELHTYSSLNKEFLQEYAKSLNPASSAAVFYSEHTLEIKKMPPLSKQFVQNSFEYDELLVCTDKNELETFLKNQKFDDSVLLLMSSGKLGGLKLEDILNFVFPI